MSYELEFLPVGENTKSGDAILFRFWDDAKGETEVDQKVCLIDAGYAENGEKIKQHMDKYYHTSTIDLVISTHPDLDHIGGLTYILENMDVKKLWLHRPWREDIINGLSDCFKDGRVTDNSIKNKLQEGLNKAYELEQLANNKKIPIEDPFTGLSEFDGVITVLSPSEEYYKQLLSEFRCTPEPVNEDDKNIITKTVEKIKNVISTIWGVDNLEENPETSAENNSSVILLLAINNKKFLLTADAGVPALHMAADNLENMGLSANCADYVQVPHHGSKHNINTKILNRIVGKCVDKNSKANKRGIVSASKIDDGKHPSKQVLNAFKQRGVNVFKTQGSKFITHSDDIPQRPDYSTAQPFDFFDKIEIEV